LRGYRQQHRRHRAWDRIGLLGFGYRVFLISEQLLGYPLIKLHVLPGGENSDEKVVR